MIGELTWRGPTPDNYTLSESDPTACEVKHFVRNFSVTVLRNAKWKAVRWGIFERSNPAVASKNLVDLLDHFQKTGCDAFRTHTRTAAFAIWDEECQRLTLVRDLVGQVSIYYRNSPDGSVIWANSLHDIINRAQGDVRLNLDWTLSYALCIDPPPESTCLKSFQSLSPGAALVVWRGGSSVRPVDSISAAPCRTIEEGVHQYREQLEFSLRRSIEGTQVRAVSFSGGVDSSIVLGFGKHCDDGHWNVITNYFEGVNDSDERALAEPVANQLGVPWYPTRLSADWDWERLAASAIEPDALDRAPFVVTYAERAKELGSEVVVSGAFGDVVTGSIPFRIPVLIRSHRIAEAKAEYERQCGRSLVSQLRFLGQIGVYKDFPIVGTAHRVKRLLARKSDPFLQLLSPDVVREFDLVNRINAFREKWVYRDLSNHDLINDYVKVSIQTGLRAARLAEQIVGIPIQHPFVEPGVLTTFAGIPRDWHLDAQGDRALVRRAATEIVPESARVRRTKTSYSGYFNRLRKNALRGVVGQVGGPEVALLYRNRDYFRNVSETDRTVGEVQFSFLLAISGLWLHVVRRCR